MPSTYAIYWNDHPGLWMNRKRQLVFIEKLKTDSKFYQDNNTKFFIHILVVGIAAGLLDTFSNGSGPTIVLTIFVFVYIIQYLIGFKIR